jgi:hypothetical protein
MKERILFMLKVREGMMNYKDIEELAFYYVFVSYCLAEEEVKALKEEWNRQSGFKVKPWWQFVMENTKIELDIKKD